MKRFSIKILSLLMLLVLLASLFNAKIFASDVTSVANGGGTYRVDHIIEEQDLDFGIKYHNDWGYSAINNQTYSVNGAWDAGGQANSAKPLVIGQEYSQNLNVLEVPYNTGLNIVNYANIKSGSWTLTTVTAFIDKYEKTHPEEKVIAAINGDFFDISSKQNYPKCSTGGTVSNGNYYKVNSSWKSIGLKNDGSTTSLVGNIMPTISDKPVLDILNGDEVIYSVNVDNINKEASGNETSVFFSFYNENHAINKENVTDAYIVSGDEIAPYSMNSVYGKGEITKIASVGLEKNQFAIKTNNNELKEYLKVGTTVRVQYVYTGELEGVDNVIGYPANIVLDGEEVKVGDYRNPHTMIGIKEDGTIVMAVCDGRQTGKGYYGTSPIEQAAIMKHYGCINAFNLDGGGSSTMVIRENGEFVIKNSPSDGSPRSDSNCLLITVKVPTLNVTFEDVTTSALTFDVKVEKEIEKYKDLYVYLNGEYKQVENGKATFTNLNRNTNYVYKFYAMIDNELMGLPITGTVSSGRMKYVLDNSNIEVQTIKGEECYVISFDFIDTDNTIVNSILVIDGKNYYISNGKFIVPVSVGLSNHYTKLIVTYDLNDNKNRYQDIIYDFNISYTDASTCLKSMKSDINSWFKETLGEK